MSMLYSFIRATLSVPSVLRMSSASASSFSRSKVLMPPVQTLITHSPDTVVSCAIKSNISVTIFVLTGVFPSKRVIFISRDGVRTFAKSVIANTPPSVYEFDSSLSLSFSPIPSRSLSIRVSVSIA